MKRNCDYIEIGKCEIHKSVHINSGSIIGKIYRPLLDGSIEKKLKTIIKQNAYIGYYSIIGNGSRIGENTIVDDMCIIESSVKLGKRNLIIYKSQICNNVKIGNECVIGGMIGENTLIGNKCRIFGCIVHSQNNPTSDWDADDSVEEAPRIKDSVFIGYGAKIIGDIEIGPKSYICAGAIITVNVPTGFVAHGFNKLIHHSKLISKLKNSNLFL